MLAMDDTIAAIATARGGLRGLVRLSGPDAHAILDRVTTGCVPTARKTGVVRVGILLHPTGMGVRQGGGVVLPASAFVFRGPWSYTGQDSVEILTVGNPIVLERVLDLVLDAGARRATPGEFSARAYLYGKLTLAEAEGIAARIAAKRDGGLDAAERVRSGQFGRRCAGWSDRLADLLALVEAGIDFSDQEDVVAIRGDALVVALAELTGEIRGDLGPGRASEVSREIPSVVLVGPPNAGKSTLFNALVGIERSVVSDEAGTTRDAIAESIVLGPAGGPDGVGEAASGTAVRLVDLPGLDGSGDGLEQLAQQRALAEIASAELLLACDPSGRFAFVDGLDDRPALRIITKGDQLPADLAGAAMGGQGSSIAVCALDGWHLDQLREAVADHAHRGEGGESLIPRHRRALASACEWMRLAQQSVTSSGAIEVPEAVAASLRSALDELGSVSGKIAPDAVLGRVFASFCVGK